MMNRFRIFIHILLFTLVLQVHARGEDSKKNGLVANSRTEIYVSPSGNDRSDGSISRPLQSLSSAQFKVRMLKRKGYQDITVILRGGTYTIKTPLIFGSEDSGKKGHPIIWKAFEEEEPVLCGGIEVSNWQKGENDIWQTKLDRNDKLQQLVVNDIPATLSKYKKEVKGQGGFGKFVVNGDEFWASRKGEEFDGLLISKTDFPEILRPADLEIRTQTGWTTNQICVRDIQEEGNKWILLLDQPFGAISQSCGFSVNSNCSFFNAKEFITEPGEFYFDRIEKTLYYKPREGEDMATAKVIAPQLESFIKIQGKNLSNHVSEIQFQGLTFACTAWQMMRVENSYGACSSQANCFSVKYGPENWHDNLYQSTDLPSAAVEVSSADHIVFEGNIFKNIGSVGIKYENDVLVGRIEGNVFQFIGGTAITIGHPQHVFIGKQNGENEGFGPYNIDNSHDKWAEDVEGLCTDVLISNNLIRNTGIEHLPSTVIMAYFGYGLNISHNDIEYAPYSGISLGWGWEEWNGIVERSKGKPSLSLRNNSVIGNKIGHVLQTLHDGGGIYLLSRQSAFVKDTSLQQWTPICRNYLYDFGGVTRAGVHTDNGAEYFLCCSNVFNHIPWSLIKASEYGQKGHIRIEGNFANTALYFTEGNHHFAPHTVIKDNEDVENDEWPEEAKKIMEESGIESKYWHLFQKIQK